MKAITITPEQHPDVQLTMTWNEARQLVWMLSYSTAIGFGDPEEPTTARTRRDFQHALYHVGVKLS